MARSDAIARALDRADPAIRCYLLYGPDESGSRALGARLAKALGPEAERIDLEPARLKADPALLADEAASVSLFGGARYIRVEGVGDECLAAIEALLEAPAAGNPVLLIAGALKRDSRLVKRVEAAPAAMTFASYVPEGMDAARLVVSFARERGLRADEDIARRLVAATGGDRALLAGEIEKIALYADARPDVPVDLSHDMLDAIGADAGEADLGRMVDAITGGNEAVLDEEIARLAAEGQEGIPLIRAVLRRLFTMAGIRADIDRGASPNSAMERAGRGLFKRDREAIGRDIGRWPSPRIAKAIERLGAAERQLKASAGPGPVAAEAEFFTIARAARRR
jgi:DNA polymerase-3 subunit delta